MKGRHAHKDNVDFCQPTRALAVVIVACLYLQAGFLPTAQSKSPDCRHIHGIWRSDQGGTGGLLPLFAAAFWFGAVGLFLSRRYDVSAQLSGAGLVISLVPFVSRILACWPDVYLRQDFSVAFKWGEEWLPPYFLWVASYLLLFAFAVIMPFLHKWNECKVPGAA